ncbi:hypothetical protein CPB84DRAFT_1750913 [Gymnopilus junonius]|uniref:Uncharacterized protein n=1 Tax=Gymnopilus junonius TaxID=109634 RepID=A0A9P5THS3_GYMJU|nr:hypothetical protein CPB84DRAFT_1750913 [Gymnopilus junonius]
MCSIEPPPMSIPPTNDELTCWNAYLEALKQDLIGKCQNIVASCHSSGQHWQALLLKIEEGNKTGYWKVLELYIAIHDFLLDLGQSDVSDSLALSESQKSILQNIHQVLQVAHLTQELLSAEWTPTLSMALPVFETLILKWKMLAATIPELKHFIDLGILKLEEYISQTRKTQLYALAMILNPGQKFSWFNENDPTGEDEKNAQKWILEAVHSKNDDELQTT